jgi:transposase
MSQFKQWSHNQAFLLPPDLCDWIPQDDLVHFVIEAVGRVDMTCFRVNARGTGDDQYHPRMMLSLLLYCYANGIFSSRRIERATYRDIGVRYLTADTHPDHDTICKFRRENLSAVSESFVQVLLLAKELQLLKVGLVSVDGTKVDANANKSRSVRYDRAKALSQQLRLEVDELLKQAEKQDRDNAVDPQSLPEEIARRESLRSQLDGACRRLEARARARAESERERYEKIVQARAERRGRKKGGQPKAPDPSPEPREQSNLTDPDSRLMRKNKRSEYRQSYNAQAVVTADGSQLILSAGVSQCASDRNELVSAVSRIPDVVGRPGTVLADNGYANGNEVAKLERMGVEALVATGAEGRRRLHDFRPELPAKPVREPKADWLIAMKKKMESESARSKYRLRKQTVEPVFGIIKNVLRFTRFSLRGLEKVRGEWELVALSYNLKRLHKLAGAPAG